MQFSNVDDVAKNKKKIDCKMNKIDDCWKSWTTEKWNLTDSLKTPLGPVFDQRWEEFTEHGIFDRLNHPIELRNTTAFSISVRAAARVTITLCNGSKYKQNSCYSIIIGNYGNTKSVIQKCSKGIPMEWQESDEECRQFKVSFSHKPLSATEWRTFLITWDSVARNISVFDAASNTVFMKYQDNEQSNSSKNYHMFIASINSMFYRFHIYTFLHTTVENAILRSPIFQFNNKMICIQLLAGLCAECDINITLYDATHNIELKQFTVKGSSKATAHGLPTWQFVTIEHLTDQSFRKGVLSISVNPYVFTYVHTSSNLTCQKLFYDEHTVVSSLSDVKSNMNLDDTECPEGKFGPRCSVSCDLVSNAGNDCKDSAICYQNGCTCFPGFMGRYCSRPCQGNMYGQNCNKTCDSCMVRKESTSLCNKVTGVCNYGCNNHPNKLYIPPMCQMSITKPGAPLVNFINTVNIQVKLLITWKEEYDGPLFYSFIIQTTNNININGIRWKPVFQNVTELTGVFTNLKSNVIYYIICILRACNQDGKLCNDISSERHIVEINCNQSNFFLIPEEHSLSINWKNELNVKKYYGCTDSKPLLNNPNTTYLTNDTTITIQNLHPYALYNAEVVVYNSQYNSEPEETTFETKVSAIATEVYSNINVQGWNMTWEPPEDCRTITGPLYSRIQIYGISDDVKDVNMMKQTAYYHLSLKEIQLDGAERYMAKLYVIRRATGLENHFAYQTYEFETPSKAPDQPDNFTITTLNNSVVDLQWCHPWKTGSPLEYFRIQMNPISTNLQTLSENDKFPKNHSLPIKIEFMVSNYTRNYHERLYLLPSTQYLVSIQAVTYNNRTSKIMYKNFETPSTLKFNGHLKYMLSDSMISLDIPPVLNNTKNSMIHVIVKGPKPCEEYLKVPKNLQAQAGVQVDDDAWQAAELPTQKLAGKPFIIGFYNVDQIKPDKNKIDCKMKKSDECLKSWITKQWNFTESFITPLGPVFDKRWEEFTQHGLFDRHAHFVTLKNTTAFSFSIRNKLKEINVIICNSPNISRQGLCYLITMGSSNNSMSTIRKCPAGISLISQEKINKECNKIKGSFKHSPLSSTKWRTFLIMWNSVTRNISVYDADNNDIFIKYRDEEKSNSTSIYSTFIYSNDSAFIRLHTYTFLHTTVENTTLTSPIFQFDNGTICIQLLIGLCAECDINIVLFNAIRDKELKKLTVKGSLKAAIHGLPTWQFVTIEHLTKYDNAIMELTPKLNSKSSNPLWAVANVRQCPKTGSLRKSIMLSKHNLTRVWPNVTCQKLFYDNRIVVSSIWDAKLNMKLDDAECPEGRIGPRCLEFCKRDDEGNHVCKASAICFKDGCTCPAGYVGAHCTKPCEKNTYGHDCKKACGSCMTKQTKQEQSTSLCNIVNGTCNYGCNINPEKLYIPPLCQMNKYEGSLSYSFRIRGRDGISNNYNWKPIFQNTTNLLEYCGNLDPGTIYHIAFALRFCQHSMLCNVTESEWQTTETNCRPSDGFLLKIEKLRLTINTKPNAS
ncbi:hypothetical protein DMN91_006442, partial [Ooceraea biroi]